MKTRNKDKKINKLHKLYILKLACVAVYLMMKLLTFILYIQPCNF